MLLICNTTLTCAIPHSDIEQQSNRLTIKEDSCASEDFFFPLLQCRERSIKTALDMSICYIVYNYFIIMATTTEIASFFSAETFEAVESSAVFLRYFALSITAVLIFSICVFDFISTPKQIIERERDSERAFGLINATLLQRSSTADCLRVCH